MKKIENKISSREIAEMMGKQHKHILEKIDKLNEDLISLSFGQSKYWVESSFIDDKNRTYREYQVTELGCELIAHKTIGKDGTAFTVKYMDRFHKMKEIIEDNKPKLPTDYLSALKALVASEEEKQQLQLENNHKQEGLSGIKPIFGPLKEPVYEPPKNPINNTVINRTAISADTITAILQDDNVESISINYDRVGEEEILNIDVKRK